MIPGVILAAGASSRIGRPKALLPTGIEGETFLSRLVETLWAGGVDDVIVVASTQSGDIERALAGVSRAPRVVDNLHPERGQLSSLWVALAAIDKPGVSGMLLTLVDVPFVSPSTVRIVLATFLRTGGPIVRPASGDTHGHPVMFGRRLFDELRQASNAAGAKTVVRAHAADIANVPVDDQGAFADVDTREDYERIVGPWPFVDRVPSPRL